MRLEIDQRIFSVTSGSTFEFTLEAHNTSEVIDSYRLRVIGLDADWVHVDPDELALFPDSSGTFRVRIRLPGSFPAGSHQLTVEVASQVDSSERELVHLDLSVSPRSDVILEVRPKVVTARRRARFTVVARNHGNTPVEMSLTGSDTETVTTLDFEPPFFEVGAGDEATSLLTVKARPPFFGVSATRSLMVRGLADEVEPTAAAVFSQKPRIPAGFMTILVLVGVLAAWVAAVLLGLNLVLSSDDQAKMAPASFFASLPGQEAAAGGPLDVQAVGGSVSGQVLSAAGEGVERISVEAVRERRGVPILVGAAATDEDGNFQVDGLLPGTYKLRFTSDGFDEVWYPSAPSADGAEKVKVQPKTDTADISVTMTGLPGTFTGRVDTGEGSTQRTVTVEVRPVVDDVVGELLASATTDESGGYVVPGIPTPGTYRLSFVADGFTPLDSVETVGGGEQVSVNTVRLEAGKGSIGGTVTSGGTALGGVKVTATSGEEEFTTETPTSGRIGTYLLERLPSPGTYLLKFELDGHGIETLAVELGPGEALTSVDVTLTEGDGQVTGRVRSADGTPLGDVTVTASGGTTSATTKTLTSGTVGTYELTGVPTPGSYTLTFAKEGFADATRTVTLAEGQAATGIDVVMQATSGSITGRATDADTGTGLAEVTVEITDGSEVRSTQTASNPRGAYSVENLAPGAYTVTFTKSGYDPHTVLVDLAAGDELTVDAGLEPTS